MEIKEYIASIPGFPKEGIIFRDVTPILQNASVMNQVMGAFDQFVKEVNADVIIGPEARGFLFGTPLAIQTHKPFVPVRKPGKLPRKTISVDYGLEYGHDTLCMHADAIKPGQKVVIVDDLLATGGTSKAMIQMVNELGGQVAGACFVIELDELHGRDVFDGIPILSLTHFEGE